MSLTTHSKRAAIAAVVGAALLLSCSDPTSPIRLPGLHVVALPHTSAHDTIGSELPGLLEVQLNDSVGRPLANTPVSFKPLSPPGVSPFEEVILFHAPADSSNWWSVLGIQLDTDSSGTVQALVKLGNVAGRVEAVLRAQFPGGGSVVDTVRFLVAPGAPVSIDLQPGDSALYEGGSYALRMTVFDRAHNERDDRPTIGSDSTAISLGGGAVSARHVGRALLLARLGDVVDSAWVSVVPHGVLAATRAGFGDQPDQLLQFELDGSDFQVLDARSIEQVSWAPSGKQLTFVDRSAMGYFYGGRVFLRDAQGAERPLLADYTDYETQISPRFSSDEKWVYFAGRTTWTSIVRAHTDGTGFETLASPPIDSYGSYFDPAPSPDGRYLAYTAFSPCCLQSGLRIVELATGNTVLGPAVSQPRWMVGSDSIVASTGAGFSIVRLDGTVARTVAAPLYGGAPFDLSPDGKWVAVSSNHGEWGPRTIDLVRLEDGMRLPLGYTIDMGSPAWRP